MTHVGGQGCTTLRLRYNDYDAIVDMRNPMQLLPPEGTQGPLAVPDVVRPGQLSTGGEYPPGGGTLST